MNITETLISALSGQGLSADLVEGRLRVQRGAGPRRRQAEFSEAEVASVLQQCEGEAELKCGLTAFARGVAGVLAEPLPNRGEEYTFTDAAALLLPSVERREFLEGVRLAGGAPPAHCAFNDQLRTVYYMELDQGMRLLPEAQVGAWNIHPERLYKAALSVLFHRSGFGEAEPLEGYADVERWAIGDGFDPARALLLDFFDYARCRKGVLFAFPSHGELLVRDLGDDAENAAFVALVRARHLEAAEPLCAEIFAYSEGRRVAAPVAS